MVIAFSCGHKMEERERVWEREWIKRVPEERIDSKEWVGRSNVLSFPSLPFLLARRMCVQSELLLLNVEKKNEKERKK